MGWDGMEREVADGCERAGGLRGKRRDRYHVMSYRTSIFSVQRHGSDYRRVSSIINISHQ